MKNMTLENIAEACGGSYFGKEQEKQIEIRGAVTDSRQVEEGFLFIPVKGARVDGHDFIPQVCEKFLPRKNWRIARSLISWCNPV